ncbi:precorrin-6y C5,15-methyltransferase (decarboxylating), CbiE subunit [Methanococcus vannielii SB]|uniref:Precorrin-6y C5,15-methyltransferase (Decarboxylating), CbiE subunit n=1 Tax=Methanococcus vannielii (strain ATCC 35089 / DSM 1224 / JCM 13029 / OCM 148 / SB) TaxID=406327 RepID=A6UPM5_METVS|nr:cobalt-precorrin-7 (C(5))-methyltransferase [Methanococcus vannielii]ABR54447.1 precorrin-6y C5,15-methyltransferase (decarboxylating), CbiE subunit [Methanococcus vannielii SB]
MWVTYGLIVIYCKINTEDGNMIYIVGIGPGNRNYITIEALNTVKNSEVVIGSKRALKNFEINGEVIELTKNLKLELYNFLKEHLKTGNKKNVSILSTGDPCFSGLLKTVLDFDFIKKEDIEVISGISSIQYAASKLKISSEDYRILTLHGKEENLKKLLECVKNKEKVIFLPNNIKRELGYLINNGVSKDITATILENLSYDNEKIVTGPICNLINENYSYLLVCVIN